MNDPNTFDCDDFNRVAIQPCSRSLIVSSLGQKEFRVVSESSDIRYELCDMETQYAGSEWMLNR